MTDLAYMTPEERQLTRLEVKLESHIESEEMLLNNVLEELKLNRSLLRDILTKLGIHGERSQNQHDRISRTENVIVWGGGLFATVFTGLVAALLTGAL